MIDFTLAEILTGLDLSDEALAPPPIPVSPPDDIDLAKVEAPKAKTDK